MCRVCQFARLSNRLQRAEISMLSVFPHPPSTAHGTQSCGSYIKLRDLIAEEGQVVVLKRIRRQLLVTA